MRLYGPGENDPLLAVREGEQRYLNSASEMEVSPIVTPLQFRHLKKASATWFDAFENDPVLRYIDNNREQTPDIKNSTCITMLIGVWKYRKISLTVDAGASLIICTPPTHKPTQLQRFIDCVFKYVKQAIARLLRPREEWKRAEEVQRKVQEAINMSLGDRVDTMYHLIVATEPASQGWGYGGALLDSIGALSDATDQAIWLQCSNEKSIGFFQHHGYVDVAQVIVGENNPTWHRKPVIIRIMVREPRRLGNRLSN